MIFGHNCSHYLQMPQSISEIKSWKMELILTRISKYDSYVTVFYTYERTAVLIIWG